MNNRTVDVEEGAPFDIDAESVNYGAINCPAGNSQVTRSLARGGLGTG